MAERAATNLGTRDAPLQAINPVTIKVRQNPVVSPWSTKQHYVSTRMMGGTMGSVCSRSAMSWSARWRACASATDGERTSAAQKSQTGIGQEPSHRNTGPMFGCTHMGDRRESALNIRDEIEVHSETPDQRSGGRLRVLSVQLLGSSLSGPLGRLNMWPWSRRLVNHQDVKHRLPRKTVPIHKPPTQWPAVWQAYADPAFLALASISAPLAT